MRPQTLNTDIEEFQKLSQKQKYEHIIKFGALAPSSHNTQPWLFKFSENENLIFVYYDPKRQLQTSDPTGREMYLSIGAAVENIIQAAKHFGFSALVEPVFEKELVVKLFLKENNTTDKNTLVHAILTRHNNRFPFEEKAIALDFMNWLSQQATNEIGVFVVSDAQNKAKIKNVVGRALEVALNDHAFRQELSHWVRPTSKNNVDGMPGDNLGMPKPISYLFPTLLRKVRMGKVQRKSEEKNLQATASFCILATKQDNATYWFECGRQFENIALHAEKAGIKIGVLAAAIEMPGFEKELQEILQTTMRPQMFFRMGYVNKIPAPSPRLNHTELIKE